MNRVKGLLATQGIYDYEPMRRHRLERLEALTTAMERCWRFSPRNGGTARLR